MGAWVVGCAVVTDGVAEVRVGSAVVRVGVGLAVVGVGDGVGLDIDTDGLTDGTGSGLLVPLVEAHTAPPMMPSRPTRTSPPITHHLMELDDPPSLPYGSIGPWDGGSPLGGTEPGTGPTGTAAAAPPEAGITWVGSTMAGCSVVSGSSAGGFAGGVTAGMPCGSVGSPGPEGVDIPDRLTR